MRSPFATAPAWSLIAIVVATFVSVQLIPERLYYPPDALRSAALVLTVGLLLGTAVAAARNRISLFRVENILCFGLFYWLLLDLILGQGDVGLASYGALVESFVAIALFAAALWTGSILATLSAPAAEAAGDAPVSELGPRFLFVAALVSGVLGVARVLVGCRFSVACIVDVYYQPRFSAVWSQVDTFGPFDTLFLYSRYFGFLVLPLTVALVNREGRYTWRSISTLLLGMVCLVFMVADGGRKDVGTIVGASLIVWVLMKQRVALRQLAGIAIASAALVFLMQFMLVARDIGLAAALARGSPSHLGSVWPVGTVDRNFRFLGSIIQLVPDQLPHNGWQGVAFAATEWVPGGLVPAQWQRRTVDMPGRLGMQVGRGYTWTCSAIGDLYLIGGFPAVLAGGLLFGVLARRVSRLLAFRTTSERAVLYALLTMTLFMSLRALHEFFVTGFIALAFFVVVWLLHRVGRPVTVRAL